MASNFGFDPYARLKELQGSDSDLVSSDTFEHISTTELISLCATDYKLFTRTFFPKTARQDSPPMMDDVWKLLESEERLVSLQLPRGFSKTSTLRMFGTKRICFGLAHTILWVGKSQDHAIHSVKWLRKQIEFNHKLSKTFNLMPGSKWQDVECEILHGIDDYTITILALGVTGSVRGVNIDDYRPDLIILDDVLDEENTATPMQRQKMEDLIYGALKESLAPRSEAPDAKMVMLQTPQNNEDVSMKSLRDPEWAHARFSCWTKETENLPIQDRESSWPERFPTEELKAERLAAQARNQLSIFAREKECKIISSELTAFMPSWIKYYDIEPDDMNIVMAIDPVPPPSDIALAKGLRNKDFECLAVCGRKDSDYYLIDYSLKTGHEPDWTISEFFRLVQKYHPRQVIVESVAYQRTLAWLIKKAMDVRRIYVPINELVDKQKKFNRIINALSGISSAGHLYVKKEHTDFIDQFLNYSAIMSIPHDDCIDAVSMALTELQGNAYSYESFNDILKEERQFPRLDYQRGAP